MVDGATSISAILYGETVNAPSSPPPAAPEQQPAQNAGDTVSISPEAAALAVAVAEVTGVTQSSEVTPTDSQEPRVPLDVTA